MEQAFFPWEQAQMGLQRWVRSGCLQGLSSSHPCIDAHMVWVPQAQQAGQAGRAAGMC
jgi:hypothetical protein